MPGPSSTSTLREYRLALAPDDSAMSEMEAALGIAERSGVRPASGERLADAGQCAGATAETDAERDRGHELLDRGQRRIPAPGTTSLLRSSRSSMSIRRVRGLGGEIAMTPYRSCAPASTILFRGGTAAGVGRSCDGCSGGHTARSRARGDVAEAEAAIERSAAGANRTTV